MKKILFAVPLLTVMFSFMACDPITDKEGPGASVSADELTSDLQITAESDEGQIMGLKHKNYDIRGIQFHPESVLTPEGKTIIKNWLNI